MVNLKNKVKAIAILGLTGLIVFSGVIPHINVLAKENEEAELINNCTELNDEQAAEIYSVVENNIMQRYADAYDFANFSVMFNDVETSNSRCVIDVDVFADMTLVANPAESAYAEGMQEAVEAIEDAGEKAAAQNILDENLEDMMKGYNCSQLTGFLYRVSVSDLENFDINNVSISHRVDITDEEVELAPIGADESLNALGVEDGKNAIQRAMAVAYGLERAVSYNKDNAVTYATDHAKDEPEFSKANGMGSDCANFVSKCINAGGIPIDEDGNWYPSPKAGSYAGTNWMRTGYNNNGGVVPYMTDKGYFASGSSSTATLGSILYWNKKSHVALVTSVDQYGNIKYSQHSNVKMNNVYYAYSSTMEVTFYVPSV